MQAHAPATVRTPLQIEPLSRAHVATTARILAQAFEVDAAYRYLFPDPARRQAGLRDFFARNLQTHLPHRCVHVARSAAGHALGTVTLRPPEGLHISMLTMLRRGLLPFALAQGRDAVKRLLWLKRTYDGFEAELAAKRPHWYVHMMAVAPEAQGQGAGSELLDRVLTDATRSGPRAPIVLTTHLERNLAFYARAGFALQWQRRVQPPDAAPYDVWAMARD